MSTHTANPDSLNSMLRALEASDSGETEFTEAWSQGRSAFGGLSAAFATTAMRRLLSEPKPIRSLMVSFIAPVPPGPVRCEARIQREGRSVTQMAAELYVGDQLCLQAMGVFGHGRPSRRVPADRPVEMAPLDSGIAFDTHARQLPSFLHFFEGSWVNGVMPFRGLTAREMKFWVRHREVMTDLPVERLVTLADIPPPVILSHYTRPPVPSSSLSWSLEFVKDPDTVDTDWCYLEFDLEAAAEGYTQQSGRLYDEQGQLLVMSRQCMVFFEPKADAD